MVLEGCENNRRTVGPHTLQRGKYSRKRATAGPMANIGRDGEQEEATGAKCRYCFRVSPSGYTRCQECRMPIAPPEGRLRVVNEWDDEVQEGERPEEVSDYLHRRQYPGFEGPELDEQLPAIQARRTRRAKWNKARWYGRGGRPG